MTVTSPQRFNEPFIESRSWVDHSKLSALINESDICVFPSIWEEPFGISVLEAMACGKAVVGSDAGGIPEIIEDSKSGVIFRRNQDGDLENKLELLMDNENLRLKLGESARKRIEENYSWELIIERYYQQLFLK